MFSTCNSPMVTIMQNQNGRGAQPPRPQNSDRQHTQTRKKAVQHQKNVQRTRSYPIEYRMLEYQNAAKRQQKQRVSIISGIAVILVVTIFVSMSLLVVRSVNWKYVFSDKSRQPFENLENLEYGPYLTAQERDSYLTQYITVAKNEMYAGPCILVNLDTPYHFPQEDPDGAEYMDMYSIYKNKTSSYKVSNGKLFLRMDAIQALNAWCDAFYAEYQNRNIMVNTAYRTLKTQADIFDSFTKDYGLEYAESYAQRPGYSEHHSGYAVDLAVFDEGDPDVEGDEAMWRFDGQGDYFWAAQNSVQYGYILRYSASKEDITGIAYESWHYRYVGIGNALAIQNMGLSLEEYINVIKDYRYDGTRYYVTANNGDLYCNYFVLANDAESQQIPVPKTAKNYLISGNNMDGFVVSALLETGQ